MTTISRKRIGIVSRTATAKEIRRIVGEWQSLSHLVTVRRVIIYPLFSLLHTQSYNVECVSTTKLRGIKAPLSHFE